MVEVKVFITLFAMPDIAATFGHVLAALEFGSYGARDDPVRIILLGIFRDGLFAPVVAVPIVQPMITGLGFDSVWFGMMRVVVVAVGSAPRRRDKTIACARLGH